MVVVDVDYEVYKCLHCDGIVVLRKQYPHMEMGCSISVTHYEKIPEYLVKEKLLDMEVDNG